MARLRGRAPCGQRPVAAVPHGHWKTSTFIGALLSDGLIAAGVFDGAINGELFLASIQQVLVRTLRQGDIVIMDNLRSHKGARSDRAVEATLMFIPLYSPDLNPIEMDFAELKALLRA